MEIKFFNITKLQKYISKVLDVLIAFVLLIFFASAGFQDNLVNGWYQQYLPAGIDNNINCLEFTDSLTGYIATANGSTGNYILKTTNGGDNWFISLRDTTGNIYSGLHFFNKDTAYILAFDHILKSTNAGLSWVVQCYVPQGVTNYFPLNTDTIFGADYQSIIGGFWRTTNGGTSWNKLVNFGSCNPSAIYFYNSRIGFINRCDELWKTTNGGFNWFATSGGSYYDISFYDSLIGYKTGGGIKKTTDGGLNWVSQQIPNIFSINFYGIKLINKDTVWGTGGYIYDPNNGAFGILYKTTNGGLNWGYQQPLNNHDIITYSSIDFINIKYGWSYEQYYISGTGVHTKVGGSDTTFFTGLTLYSNIVPEKFSLGQNYPNPFNPITKIPYEIKESSYIVLKVFDITGRMVKELVKGKWGTGKYIADFDGTGLSSGTYFYRIEITGETSNERFSDSKKMLMIK